LLIKDVAAAVGSRVKVVTVEYGNSPMAERFDLTPTSLRASQIRRATISDVFKRSGSMSNRLIVKSHPCDESTSPRIF